MIDRSFLVTVLNYLANGVVTTYNNQATQIAPYQVIFVFKNNNVTVSKSTATSISVIDELVAKDTERLTVKISATDASPYTYTTDEIEVWASTQNAMLYKIATLQLSSPLGKGEQDYLHAELEVVIQASGSYIASNVMPNSATFSTPVSPILFFFGLFLVPNWVNVLKQNPTFPQSQLLSYINPSTYSGINVMYVGNVHATILSRLVGYGMGYVNMVVNGEVSQQQTNPVIAIGFMSNGYVVPITYTVYSGTVTQYASIEISVPYGQTTVVSQFETKTKG